jgi:hypothetical protein
MPIRFQTASPSCSLSSGMEPHPSQPKIKGPDNQNSRPRALSQTRRRTVRTSLANVRFAPDSDRTADIAEGPCHKRSFELPRETYGAASCRKSSSIARPSRTPPRSANALELIRGWLGLSSPPRLPRTRSAGRPAASQRGVRRKWLAGSSVSVLAYPGTFEPGATFT